MLRANQQVSSKLRLTVAWCVLTSMISAQAASGSTIFFDDFNDGNARDGKPVTWSRDTGTWDASSGDYVATGSGPRVSRVTDHVLGDTSVRAQVRVVGNIDAGLGIRRPSALIGYVGAVRHDGSVVIARLDGSDSPILLSIVDVPFNPMERDIMLQFDAFGNKLSLWAWPVGNPMPNTPQLVVFDNTYSQGPAALISAGENSRPLDSTTFRSVQVADTHIVPEPSTFALLGLGGCGLLYASRRKRS